MQGTSKLDLCPLTPLVTISINVGTVWIGGSLARHDLEGAGVNFYGLILANSVFHLAPFISKGFIYNPGALTAAFLFTPAVYFAFKALLDARKCTSHDIIRAIALGFTSHAVIVGSLLLSREGVINESITCFIQVLNILPLMVSGGKRKSPG